MARIALGKRSAALLLAVVLAGVATAALVSYVQNLEDKAFEGQELVQVFVAKDDIPLGTSAEAALQRGLIERQEIPRKVAVEGAIVSLDDIRGRVAGVTILKGEQILAARFVERAQAGRGLPIPQGRQAMAVQVDIPPGVAGFIRPGNRVSIIASLDVPGPGGDEGTRAQFLLQNIEVLAVGARTVTSGDGDEDRRESTRVLMTLAVSPAEAEKLAFAIFEGEIYFTLLPPGQAPTRTPGRTAQNIFR